MNYRDRHKPTESRREILDYHRDTCRQLYNDDLYCLNQIPDSEGAVNQRVGKIRDGLHDLKEWWDTLIDVYSKVHTRLAVTAASSPEPGWPSSNEDQSKPAVFR